ncbi:hypothetical protein V3N95_11875 (plasmid) [Micrococcaceae bacterium Sec6.3]
MEPITGQDRVQTLTATLLGRYADAAPEDRPDTETIEAVAWDLTERGYDAATAPEELVRALLWPTSANVPNRTTQNRLANVLDALDAAPGQALLEAWAEEGATGFLHLILYIGGHGLETAAEHARLLLAADIDLDATMAAAGWHSAALSTSAAASGTGWRTVEVDETTYDYAPFNR